MSDFLELSEKRFSARKFTDQAVSEDDLSIFSTPHALLLRHVTDNRGNS